MMRPEWKIKQWSEEYFDLYEAHYESRWFRKPVLTWVHRTQRGSIEELLKYLKFQVTPARYFDANGQEIVTNPDDWGTML